MKEPVIEQIRESARTFRELFDDMHISVHPSHAAAEQEEDDASADANTTQDKQVFNATLSESLVNELNRIVGHFDVLEVSEQIYSNAIDSYIPYECHLESEENDADVRSERASCSNTRRGPLGPFEHPVGATTWSEK